MSSVSLIDGHIDGDEVETSKRTPKKVWVEPWWGRVAFFCPICKTEIQVECRTICDNCGQKLDWSDTK